MGTAALDRAFADRVGAGKSDISEHLALLSVLATECAHITEFGVRTGHSTIAFLHGLSIRRSGTLCSYDIEHHQVDLPELPVGIAWRFNCANTGELCDLEPTDMLFIDTWHTCDHVAAELSHASIVHRYIVFHDTTTFAGNGQGDGGGMGICPAIFDFLASDEGSRWAVRTHCINNNGLLVLKRVKW